MRKAKGKRSMQKKGLWKKGLVSPLYRDVLFQLQKKAAVISGFFSGNIDVVVDVVIEFVIDF